MPKAPRTKLSQRRAAHLSAALLLASASASAACPNPTLPVLEHTGAVYLQSKPGYLVLCDGQTTREHPLQNRDASQSTSHINGHWHFSNRESFVVLISAINEVWELSYNPTSPDIPSGKIHDFQYREGAFIPGYLNPQRGRLTPPAPRQAQAELTEHGLWLDYASQRRFYHLDVRKLLPAPANPR
ncbi:hypothetical protein [Atopomonas hussainii]|uniref:hypothetical protein n=1 Tax=Atopomonas hussainii TaxID=1429083 RepID=UPI00090026E4|nr:hypothetical protein [Atopomonas hussainii]